MPSTTCRQAGHSCGMCPCVTVVLFWQQTAVKKGVAHYHLHVCSEQLWHVFPIFVLHYCSRGQLGVMVARTTCTQAMHCCSIDSPFQNCMIAAWDSQG